MPIQTAIDSISNSQGSPFGFKNRIINGAMVFDQRNAGSSVTPASGAYTLDRWIAILTQTSKFTVQQNAGSVTPPVGFSNYLGVTSSSAYSVGSGDTFLIAQYIEGFNTSDLSWGTANAKTVTLSFQVYSSLTGTFGGAIVNSASNRSYPFSYTVSSANTWTSISVTIAGDTSGTWVGATNGVGMRLRFGLGSGATYSGTAGAWAAGDLVQPTGTVSVVGTNGATFYITGVQLEKGTQATAFDYRDYGRELQLCQRYHYKILGGGNTRHAIAGNGSLSQGFPTTFFKVSMRATPSFSYSALSHFALEGLSAGGTAVPTGLSINSVCTENGTINSTSGGSGTGQGVQLLGTDTNAWTAWSAEL